MPKNTKFSKKTDTAVKQGSHIAKKAKVWKTPNLNFEGFNPKDKYVDK